MEKQYTQEKNEKLDAKKLEAKDMPQQKIEVKAEEKKEIIETKTEEKKEEAKDAKKEEKKSKITAPVKKKEEAFVNATDTPISTKHSMAICDFIRGKRPEQVIPELEKVVKLKKAIRMKGEIPHRKGGFPGRFPVNAAKVFIKIIKSLNANASVNGIDDPYIALAKANKASRPHKRGGRERFKRTNILLVAKSKIRNKEGESKKSEEKK